MEQECNRDRRSFEFRDPASGAVFRVRPTDSIRWIDGVRKPSAPFVLLSERWEYVRPFTMVEYHAARLHAIGDALAAGLALWPCSCERFTSEPGSKACRRCGGHPREATR